MNSNIAYLILKGYFRHLAYDLRRFDFLCIEFKLKAFFQFLFQCFIFRVAQGPFIEDFHQCVTHGFYTAHWQEQFYTTFTLFFMFIIPLTILIGSYLSTFRTISSEYINNFLIDIYHSEMNCFDSIHFDAHFCRSNS